MTIQSVISIIAIIISSFTLGWTIYRDFLKPRSKVTGMISYILHGPTEKGPFLSITIINKGPGKIVIKSIIAKAQKKGFFSILHDWENEYCPNLPVEVEEYDDMTQFIRVDVDNILDEKITRLGFVDSLGRYHWMKNRSFRKVQLEYMATKKPEHS